MTLSLSAALPAGPPRPPDGHKGTFGRVLIIAGSRGMSGAACLSGMAALRGGAGLVTVAVPESILPIVASAEPSYLTLPLAEDSHGRIAAGCLEALQAACERNTVVAFGPGCGVSEGLGVVVQELYRNTARPMVIDADGLNLLARGPRPLPAAAASRILTPHPGEFARLSGRPLDVIQQERETLTAEYARQNGVVLLLKGPSTSITDGQRVAINSTGNSGMGTGGTGDVLTGLIAALLAQGMPAFEAAQLGAHLHGLAGDLAAQELTQPALIASDLIRFLPRAWAQFGAK